MHTKCASANLWPREAAFYALVADFFDPAAFAPYNLEIPAGRTAELGEPFLAYQVCPAGCAFHINTMILKELTLYIFKSIIRVNRCPCGPKAFSFQKRKFLGEKKTILTEIKKRPENG